MLRQTNRLRLRARKKNRRAIILIICICLGAAVVIAAGLFFTKEHQRNNSPQAQRKVLIAEVSKLIQLPTNEQPTIATVTNQVETSKQQFFANAKDGDKVLIYSKDKIIVLYRPSENKIINAGPINGTLSYLAFTVAISNGTSNSQLTGDVSEQVSASFPNAKITAKTTANHTYPGTIVIAINTNDYALASEVADSIGGQVGILPIGEPSPNADLLIIIGQNYSY